jgi:hypothetical protein
MKAFVQQYGKERTGTNYLKALLNLNFDNIVLFDNRLGSKHEPHREVSQWMRDRGIRDIADFKLLVETDRYWRARNVPTADAFERIHQPVSFDELVGLATGQISMRYLISIKDPYASIVSVTRWWARGQTDLTQPPDRRVTNLSHVEQYCHEFNSAYLSYRPLIETERAVLVRFEDLIRDPTAVLTRISVCLDFDRRHESCRTVSTTVVPGYGITNKPFYLSYYTARAYLSLLTPTAIDTANRILNWDVMRYYGYQNIFS